ncbi:hypothetical protein ACROYT_G014520 [Oculina patagonica]
MDGTVRPIARPGERQRVLYNGHKRVHALKFQSVDHAEICCACYKLNKVLADIEIACTEVESVEEREDTMCSSTFQESGVQVERFDFSDPQGGKGEVDRQAATIKGHINIYLNEGHDVNSAVQMKEAIESNGGIPGVIVKYVKMSESSPNKVSTLNNFQFDPSGIRVWKAFKIGPGKLVPWENIQSNVGSSKLDVLESPVRTEKSCLRVIKSRQDHASSSTKDLSSSPQNAEAVQDEEELARRTSYSHAQKRVASRHTSSLKLCRRI